MKDDDEVVVEEEEEKSDATVILEVGGDDDEKGKDEEGEGDEGGEEEGEEDETGDEGEDEDEGEDSKPAKRAPTVKEIIAEVRAEEREAKGESEKKEEGPKKYSVEELDAAEDKLEEMLEDREIDRVKYRQYMRNINRIRREMDDDALAMRIEGNRRKQGTDEMIENWASENAPEYLNTRTKASQEAVKWAMNTLGAEQRGDEWVLSKKVGQVAFGVLHKGQQGGNGEREAGRREGLADKKARAEELRGRDTKVPSSKGGKDKDAPVTKAESAVAKRLGLSKDQTKLARKIKNAGKNAVVEAGG